MKLLPEKERKIRNVSYKKASLLHILFHGCSPLPWMGWMRGTHWLEESGSAIQSSKLLAKRFPNLKYLKI